jgi:hypothetical protein
MLKYTDTPVLVPVPVPDWKPNDEGVFRNGGVPQFILNLSTRLWWVFRCIPCTVGDWKPAPIWTSLCLYLKRGPELAVAFPWPTHGTDVTVCQLQHEAALTGNFYVNGAWCWSALAMWGLNWLTVLGKLQLRAEFKRGGWFIYLLFD